MSVSPCPTCNQPHVTRRGGQACTGHISGGAHPERKGEACTNDPMTGQKVCGSHGGRNKNAKAAGKARASEEKAREMAARWSVPIETSPTDAILDRIRAFAGHVAFYKEQVDKLDTDAMVFGVTKQTDHDVVVGDGKSAKLEKAQDEVREAAPNVWIQLYNDASRDLVKFSAEALRIGIEERRVRMAERDGALVADVIRCILTDLDLTATQRKKVSTVVPMHLRRLAMAS